MTQPNASRERYKSKFEVYSIEDSLNTIIYIGQGQAFKRSSVWLTPRKKEQLGGDVKIGFRVIVETKKEALDLEERAIEKFKPKYNKAYRASKILGYKMSQEQKDKISSAMKGKGLGKNNGFFGKTHTKETKEKIALATKARKGKPVSEQAKLNIKLGWIKGEKNMENPERSKPNAKIILDSISNEGVRLTTVEVTAHRFVLAELNTHRAFSRNAASSRAIPTKKIRQRVLDDPAYPVVWGTNKPGMQAGEPLNDEDTDKAKEIWDYLRRASIFGHEKLEKIGLHKQWANRLLEPWMWITDIVSFTDIDNFSGSAVMKWRSQNLRLLLIPFNLLIIKALQSY